MLLFDIVIPTYNNLEELKKCLEGFKSQTVENFKVWICVDGSDDGTIEYLAALSKDGQRGFLIAFLEHADKKNHGRAATRNLALPWLSGTYVLFLDSDFVVKNDFLEQHYAVLCKDQTISLGQVMYEKDSIWRDYDLSRGMHKFRTHLAELPAKYLVTDNVSMPAAVFKELNGFDENLVSYGGEDTELGCRIMHQPGLRVVCNKKAAAFGVMSKSLEFALHQKEIFAGTNLKYILEKHREKIDILQVNFMKSWRGKILYWLIPRKLLMLASENKNIPLVLRIRFVHLLVFYHLYKGYNRK